MLTAIRIQGFQSLHDISLTLEPLTVIVGPSSTGKSAFTRALRTLTSNARGTSFITHGERQTTITATTDRGTVSLTRGARDQYTIIPEHGEQQTFTKLGGAVPEEVTEFVGIAPRDPLNYASQFDMPYLLTASASEVARTLGDLTNVSAIFNAAREANRRRLTASGTLTTRARDHAEITTRLQDFKNLPAQLTAITEAENHVRQAEEITWQLQQITLHLETITLAAHEIKNLPQLTPLPEIDTEAISTAARQLQQLDSLISEHAAAEAAISEIRDIKNLPDAGDLAAAHTRLQQLDTLITRLIETAGEIRALRAAEITAESEAFQLEAAYLVALEELGECPTCHQSTKGLTHEHR